MADGGELRMNEAAVKRVDPYVKDILETATHVALYTFNAQNNGWEKTDVEGALFVCSRVAEPFYSFLIMNRLNTNNLLEPVTQGLDLQLQEPFLLYRNSKCRIFGVWFYDKEECTRIASMLEKLVREFVLNKPDSKDVKKKAKPNNPSQIDILTMLSKAQEDFNLTRTPSSRKEPEGQLLMPKGVLDFFAKASSGGSHFTDNVPPQTATIYLGPPPRAPDMAPEGGGGSQLKPLLQRLMSNPVHSLEHIEKQQRSVTPQSEKTPVVRRSKSTSQASSDGKEDGLNLLKMSSGNLMELEKGQADIAHILENGMSFLRIASPGGTRTGGPPPMAPFLNSGLQAEASDQRPVSAPLCGETPTKAPALMPPTMFTSSATKDTPLRPLPPDESIVNTPEPLTKNQLLQAFNYLIKNDPEFVNKLHEAYVKSFAELVL